MWVCICHALTDTDIQDAEAKGAKNELEVFGHYGVRPQCGRCVPTVKCLMKCQNKPAACQAIAEAQAAKAEIKEVKEAREKEAQDEEEIQLEKASSF
jgi:bacterioferritin-associated ferredoxin